MDTSIRDNFDVRISQLISKMQSGNRTPKFARELERLRKLKIQQSARAKS